MSYSKAHSLDFPHGGHDPMVLWQTHRKCGFSDGNTEMEKAQILMGCLAHGFLLKERGTVGSLSSQPPAASTAPPPDPQPRGSSPISQSNPRDELAGQGPSVSASGTGPPLRDVTIFPAMGPSLHRLLPHPHRTNGTPNLGISCLISQDGPSIPGPAWLLNRSAAPVFH